MTFLHRNIACNYYVAFCNGKAGQTKEKKTKTENKWIFHPSLTMCFLFPCPPAQPIHRLATRPPEKMFRKTISSSVSVYHKWRITPLYVHLLQPAHTDEWWMNVNVIKQFSVYLKLQTLTLPRPSARPAGVGSQKITFPLQASSSAETMPRILFSFSHSSLSLGDPVASSLWDFMLHVYIFSPCLEFILLGCCLSLTGRNESSPLNTTGKKKKSKERQAKKWSHNRRNMNKWYLNTNECLKIHKKNAKNDIFFSYLQHKKASRNRKQTSERKTSLKRM